MEASHSGSPSSRLGAAMPNSRDTTTLKLTYEGKTTYLPLKDMLSGRHNELVHVAFDRLSLAVRNTSYGVPLEDHYYLVEASKTFADIWQVTQIVPKNEWRAEATLVKLAHLQDNILSP